MLATGNNPIIAAKIAALLNQNNNLMKVYSATDIFQSKARYYPIVLENIVLASVALEKLNFLITEIKHLVVPTQLRGIGLAKRLVSIILAQVKTPYIIASVRQDNPASLKIFEGLGFSILAPIKSGNHYLNLLGRQKSKETTNA